ncbi:MAG: tRNA (adenosine(37)-N6)-threonylcarbamoyltransferase complex ATPase subunit type 1 TsaE [Bradymonadales bacterium]|nr:tRNA (adenosine(37)-N6)-threonylcarbamoyltransferase complex ATPase subunit type 1 TsaE [Bradymonadales bacterium]
MPPSRTRRFTSHSSQQTQSVAACLASVLQSGDLVGLQGDLGAGKTTFTRGLVAALPSGTPTMVSSPSFAITNLYHCQPPVCHLDFYRLDGLDDLEGTGYWDLLDDGRYILVVEWSDRIPQAFHSHSWSVRLTILSDSERLIEIEAPADRIGQLLLPDVCEHPPSGSE